MYCCVDCGSSTGSTTPTFASITTKYGQDKEATNLIIVLALIWCLVDTHYLDEPFFRWIHRNGVAWLGESRPSPLCLFGLPAGTYVAKINGIQYSTAKTEQEGNTILYTNDKWWLSLRRS